MFLWCLDVGAWSFSFRASSRRLLQNDRGRDKGLNLAPPSEPDGRISRLRLSSRWVLCREGAALRLVPQCGGLTFGVRQANGTWRTPPLAIHMRINKATLVSRKPCRERIFVLSAVF